MKKTVIFHEFSVSYCRVTRSFKENSTAWDCGKWTRQSSTLHVTIRRCRRDEQEQVAVTLGDIIAAEDKIELQH